jgi:N-hydroxyarylamine O-acetyltransferase
MCHYQQHSPDSVFTRHRTCTRATPEGRITLRDSRLIIRNNGQRSIQKIPDELTYQTVLREHFGIVMSE